MSLFAFPNSFLTICCKNILMPCWWKNRLALVVPRGCFCLQIYLTLQTLFRCKWMIRIQMSYGTLIQKEFTNQIHIDFSYALHSFLANLHKVHVCSFLSKVTQILRHGDHDFTIPTGSFISLIRFIVDGHLLNVLCLLNVCIV